MMSKVWHLQIPDSQSASLGSGDLLTIDKHHCKRKPMTKVSNNNALKAKLVIEKCTEHEFNFATKTYTEK